MNDFQLYSKLGFEHITDLQGYDHILFLLALCAAYTHLQWRTILWMISAFSLGHTFTLALSAQGIYRAPAEIIEFLIPVTIFVTALSNVLLNPENEQRLGLWSKVSIALFFGLIHGMGFSNYFNFLMENNTGLASIIGPLVWFTLGIELGQICIVAVGLALRYVLTTYIKLPSNYWTWALSGIAIILSSQMIWERWPF